MKKTVDMRDWHETEKDSIIKEQRLHIRILWAALIFSTLLIGYNAFKMAKLSHEVKMIAEKYEDPYYQGNADIGGGMNDDLAPGPYGSDPEGNDYCSESDLQLQYESCDPIRFTIDSGNSESETVEGSQYQPRIPGPKPTPKPNPQPPYSIR